MNVLIDHSDKYLPVVYNWLTAMPDWYLELTGRKNETFEEYKADLRDDLKFTVLFDNKPEAFVTAESKSNGVYDIHFLSPRKQAKDVVKRAIFEVRDELKAIKSVLWCIFSFPVFEKSIEEALFESEAVWTGWKVRQNNVTYKILLWNAKK